MTDRSQHVSRPSEPKVTPEQVSCAQLRLNAETCDELKFEAWAHDFRSAADQLDALSAALCDENFYRQEMERQRTALQQIAQKKYHCCGADRIATEALK